MADNVTINSSSGLVLVGTKEIGGVHFQRVIQLNVTYTDNSITNATGSSEQLIAANLARRALVIINEAATDWTINPLGGTAAAGTPPGFVLHAGDSWFPDPAPTNAITGIGTAASKLIVLEG